MKKAVTKVPQRFKCIKEDVLDNFLFHKFHTKYAEHRDRDFPEFVKIIEIFNKALAETIVEHRDGVELPESLGNVFVGSCSAPKKKNVDFNATKKLGHVVYHTNHETDGHIAKIFYTNYNEKYKFQHRELWEFKPAQSLSTLVAKGYRADWKKYTLVDSAFNVHRVYLKRNAAMFRKKSEVEHGEYKYNEFDI